MLAPAAWMTVLDAHKGVCLMRVPEICQSLLQVFRWCLQSSMVSGGQVKVWARIHCIDWPGCWEQCSEERYTSTFNSDVRAATFRSLLEPSHVAFVPVLLDQLIYCRTACTQSLSRSVLARFQGRLQS